MEIPEDKYRHLLGKPFKFGGRGPDFYDCYGLAMAVCKINDIILPEKTSVTDPAIMHKLIQEGKKDFTELSGPEPFCIITLKVKVPYEDHIGVVLDDRRHFMHIIKQHNSGMQKLHVWEKRIDGYWRYTGGQGLRLKESV